MLRNPTATHPLTFFTPCFQLPLLLPTSPVSTYTQSLSQHLFTGAALPPYLVCVMERFCPQARHFRPPYRVAPWALSRDQLEPKVVVSLETSPRPTTCAPPDFELHLPLLFTGSALSPSRLCSMGHFRTQVQHFHLLYRGTPWAFARDQLEPKVVVSLETSPTAHHICTPYF